MDVSRTVSSPGPYDTACFHSQQAVEKYLKGFLAFRNQPIPRTHDLEELQRLCLDAEPGFGIAGADLTTLSGYAVEMRCDFEFWPDEEAAREALELALQVKKAILAALPDAAQP
jgi:HEPN domain-containing protein